MLKYYEIKNKKTHRERGPLGGILKGEKHSLPLGMVKETRIEFNPLPEEFPFFSPPRNWAGLGPPGWVTCGDANH